MRIRLSLVLLVALAVPAFAQDQPAPNFAQHGQGSQGGVARVAFAHQLYSLGLANKDALFVLNAARLAASVTLTDTPRAHETAGEPAGGAPLPQLSPAQMFDAAAHLAAQDEGMLDIVDAARREATFIPTVTVVSSASTLAPNQSDVWTVPIFGGSLAELALLSDTAGALSLRVTDQNGNLVCAGAAASTAPYCSFYPAENGTFLISVTNGTNGTIAYQLLTN